MQRVIDIPLMQDGIIIIFLRVLANFLINVHCYLIQLHTQSPMLIFYPIPKIAKLISLLFFLIQQKLMNVLVRFFDPEHHLREIPLHFCDTFVYVLCQPANILDDSF